MLGLSLKLSFKLVVLHLSATATPLKADTSVKTADSGKKERKKKKSDIAFQQIANPNKHRHKIQNPEGKYKQNISEIESSVYKPKIVTNSSISILPEQNETGKMVGFSM